MTDAEREAMGAHVAYWRKHLEAGKLLIFSPVADPERSWGMAVVQGEETELSALRTGDPAV
jgi:hypothetical protein